MADILGKIDMNLFSALILFYLLCSSSRRLDKSLPQNSVFTAMLICTIGMLLLDVFCALWDGVPGTFARVLNSTFNFMLYLFSPIIAQLALIYVITQVNPGPAAIRHWKIPMLLFTAFYVAIALFFSLNGWSYSIDGNNVYHRGALFYLHAALLYSMFAIIIVYVLLHRKKLSRGKLFLLLFYVVPPLLGGIIQSQFYGVLAFWPCTALSLLLIYIGIQDQNLGMDYLTGAHNRMQLDQHLAYRIEKAAKPFSALMLDINGFKYINDRYGHQTGDEALIDAVQILRGCIRSSDVIARYGGDEFLLVLSNAGAVDLDDMMQRIQQQSERFNSASGKPYRLSFSIGCAVYEPGSAVSAEHFLKLLDERMYQDKRRRQTLPEFTQFQNS